MLQVMTVKAVTMVQVTHNATSDDSQGCDNGTSDTQCYK